VKPSVEAQIVTLRDKGYGILKIGKKLGIGTSVVQRVFKEAKREQEAARSKLSRSSPSKLSVPRPDAPKGKA
jgi:transposase